MFHAKQKLLASAAAALIAVGAFTSNALAEGSFSASFSSINPGFSSRTWVDRQQDWNPTRVSFPSCYASNGGHISSLSISLIDTHGWLPDAIVGSSKKTSGCGSVSWARNGSNYSLRNSEFYWQLNAINDSWANRWLSGTNNVNY